MVTTPMLVDFTEGLREVAIFRHNLFRISEPFIAEQAQHLRRYRPFYVGRMRFGPPPNGASSLALEDLYRRCTLPRRASARH
jgi:hypothetical protein